MKKGEVSCNHSPSEINRRKSNPSAVKPPDGVDWVFPEEYLQKWIDELPLPAFSIEIKSLSIYGNQALDDWLASADPFNIYSDFRPSKKLHTLFPKLVDMVRCALQTAGPCRETFEWLRKDQRISGELRLVPASMATGGLVVGWIRERDGQARLARELKTNIKLVRMLSDISARALTIEDLYAFLDECMWLIGTTTEAGGVFLWEYNVKENTFSNICEWMQRDIPSHKGKLQAIPGDSVPDVMNAMQNHQILNIPDTGQIEASIFREVVDMMGIRSLLIIPLYIRNRLYGFIGLEEYADRRLWAEEEESILKAVAEIILRAIENKQVEKELDDYRANLETKVQNRTAELEQINLKLIREIKAQGVEIAVKLTEHEVELARKSERLAEVNSALRVLLNQLQEDRRQCEETAYRKYTELVEPKMVKLRKSGLSAKQKTYVELIEGNIKQIYVADRCYLMPEFKTLTANEIQVAELIQNDKPSKEIAELMNISLRTVEVYRYNIRKKLGLNKHKISLRNHLLSLAP